MAKVDYAEWLDGEEGREEALELLAEMEDYFVTALEHEPDSGYEADIVVNAVEGLTFAASCRRNIGAGRAAAVAWEMYFAATMQFMCADYFLAGPEADSSLKFQKGQERSRKTRYDNKLKEYRRWLAIDAELCRSDRHWNRTGRAKAIAERGVSLFHGAARIE